MAGQKILLVDDDRSIAKLCQRLLERAAYEVIACTDPMDALRILDSQKADLLITDIRMPVMDGFELIRRSKQIQPSLAVLVMTGFGSVDTAIQALYRGVDGLILKPFENTTDLVRAVERVLDESRQKQDAARAQALRPLFDVTEALLSQTAPEPLEKMIVKALVEVFKAPYVGAFCDDWVSHPPSLILGTGLPEGEENPVLKRLATMVGLVDSAAIFTANEPVGGDIQEVMTDLNWSTCLVSSVVRNEQRFIFLVARGPMELPFIDSDIELIAILARQAVVAMENSRLYTDLKNSITRLEESQRALIQAEKMAAVGRLMATMAHEINNPLQSVRNCLHLANRSDLEDEQRATYLAMTTSEVDRLVNTVRHLLDFYRPGKVDKEYVDIRAVVERVVYLLRAQMGSQSVKLNNLIDVSFPKVLGVSDQIQQVIFNLLINALDAMDGMEGEKIIWIEGSPDENGMVRLDIEDSGPGVHSEMRERLFEPFVSTKKQGTGLGLSVSYGIIENHGGLLQLGKSKHGRGARFEVYLPLQEEPGL